jgi:hypothetical protein
MHIDDHSNIKLSSLSRPLPRELLGPHIFLLISSKFLGPFLFHQPNYQCSPYPVCSKQTAEFLSKAENEQILASFSFTLPMIHSLQSRSSFD